MEKATGILRDLIINLAKRLSFLCEEDQVLQAIYIAKVPLDIKHVTLQGLTIPTNSELPPGCSEEITRIGHILLTDKICSDLCVTLHNLNVESFCFTEFSFRLKRQRGPTAIAFSKQMESLMTREE
jgi:hypothetical protein